MSDPKQVKQRLMRLAREVDGLTWADRKCIGEAIALIDEVRGVDAEPVAIPADCKKEWAEYVRTIYLNARTSSVTSHIPSHAIEAVRDILMAASKPAAPVELPVVAWFTDHLIGKKKKQLDIGDSTTNPDYRDVHKDWHWEPLVRLSDAQAAIAAGRKAS